MKTASPKRRTSRRSPPIISAVEKTAVRIMRKLYEATGGHPQRWESLGNLGTVASDAASIAYAVERGWLRISGGLHSVSLINNAGVGGGGPYGAWTDAAWNWTMGVNLMAVVWGIEIFGPLIEQHGEGGHIVSTASIAGLVSPGSNAYNVSKYGVVALSEGLRSELAPRGIGVSVLCPGFIRTQIFNSTRNLPRRFEGAVGAMPISGPSAARLNMVRERIAQGIDPHYVGELVREGVEKDWLYIFTDLEFEPLIEARFAAIKLGFDHIRGRNPRR